MKLLILAGGSGTRLWPLSRAARPKQVQPFLDNRTLLQHTWARLRAGFRPRDIFVATALAQAAFVRRQLPQLASSHLILEPVARNTAAAIGLAARVVGRLYPGEVVATINSDHYIVDTSKYLKHLRFGERSLVKHPDHLLLIGLRPTYPETGYGYIKRGRRLPGPYRPALFKVAAFKEKPSPVVARRYVQSGAYLWNSGFFLFYPKTLSALYRTHAPRLARRLEDLKLLKTRSGAWTTTRAAFQKLPAEAIDYAVVEKTRNLLVLGGDFRWADVGHWRTIYDILVPKLGANVVRGRYLGIASAGNLVYSLGGKLVTTVGINNTVIIDTGDAILICPRERAQEVRTLVTELGRLGFGRYI